MQLIWEPLPAYFPLSFCPEQVVVERERRMMLLSTGCLDLPSLNRICISTSRYATAAVTPWMYFNKFTCSWSIFDCPSVLLLTVAVPNLPTTQELLCIYREMHKVESSSSTQRRPKEMFLFYSTQARISLRQKSTPWHDFLYYGRTVTKTQRIISPTEEYNMKKKKKVMWNKATGSTQVLKKGWDIPLTDGTSATEGDLAGKARLAALF